MPQTVAPAAASAVLSTLRSRAVSSPRGGSTPENCASTWQPPKRLPGRNCIAGSYEMLCERRYSIERGGRVTCGVRAGGCDVAPVSGTQRHRQRIPLVEHIVTVAGGSRDDSVAARVAVAGG